MNKFPVSDGTIEKITCSRSTLLMMFSDWQEALWIITFHDLIAFEGIGAVGSEISEMYETTDTPLSIKATRIDPSETGTSYCFTSSHGADVIFTIVAGGYTAEKMTVSPDAHIIMCKT
ncbi:hypothetical protein GIR22_25805 [Pseudomonas sp. CCM 7891]|uniref:Uncharacterized protein n=1 Tax=Pseudomonas karstica TaxID=1055468 RepID=A0A7X2V1P1_9PSED|nr:hypothetical protein [Pseudomonas karstica]MTD22542.1 hypothetical protein [Pseudomonas karstica]